NKKLIPHNFVFWQYFLDHIFDLFYYGQFIPESRGQFNQNLQLRKSKGQGPLISHEVGKLTS
ncbi:hypothetical protein, partial [Chryseobacterium fistulae]|uniref:hypothetical protein n=1 Tax=Chryseobacterium fistulae TaxID=2675058 RepID=UPI001E56A639